MRVYCVNLMARVDASLGYQLKMAGLPFPRGIGLTTVEDSGPSFPSAAETIII